MCGAVVPKFVFLCGQARLLCRNIAHGYQYKQIAEETIWAGRPNNNANPNALEYIPRVRDQIFAGKYLEAQTLATEKVMAKTNSGMPYQSFGDLRIAFLRSVVSAPWRACRIP